MSNVRRVMTAESGVVLFFIGMTLSIVGLSIAYYYGSKEKPKDETPNALKDLIDKK